MSASQGSIPEPSHLKRVWVSFCGCGDGCACTNVSAAGLWSTAWRWGGSDPCADHPSAACCSLHYRTAALVWHSYRLLLSPSAENFSEKKILSLICSPEILPRFFFTTPRLFSIPAKHCLDLGTSCTCPLQNGVCLSCCHRQQAAWGVFGTRS